MIKFYYGCMYAGKTTFMISMYNTYKKKGLNPILLKPIIDTRESNTEGWNITKSRNGMSAKVYSFKKLDIDINNKYIFIDEGQFLSDSDIDYLIWLEKNLNKEIFVFGLRTNNNGKLFNASARLMAIANELIEIETLCQHPECTNKAVIHNRYINGKLDLSDKDIVIEKGNVKYESVCLKHWRVENEEYTINR